MAVPLIYAGVMLGRFAIPVIARYIIKNGSKKAIKKFGKKIVANTKVTKQVTQIKKITKSTTKTVKGKVVKTKPKVKMTNISAKNKNIATKADKTVKSKLTPKKIKAKPSKTDLIKKVDKKSVATKSDKVVKTVKGKPVKPKVDKVVKTKTKKIDKATKTKKVDKVVKTVKGKPVKTKPSNMNLPIIVGGGLTLAALMGSIKKKAPNFPKGLTPPSVLNPKPSTGSPRTKDGMKEVKRRREDAIGSARKSSGPTTRPKLNMDRGNSYENRIRRLVSKKDALTKIEASDGVRSEYQVRMNKLKKENPKEFRKLFKMGGFGNLKD
jgi:hypothetical protein